MVFFKDTTLSIKYGLLLPVEAVVFDIFTHAAYYNYLIYGT